MHQNSCWLQELTSKHNVFDLSDSILSLLSLSDSFSDMSGAADEKEIMKHRKVPEKVPREQNKTKQCCSVKGGLRNRLIQD